jgi:RimJ/RimL family protein N-acetyltransferase
MKQLYLRSNARIGVRPLTSADTEALFSLVTQSLESLCYWMPWCNPDYSRDDSADWTAFCDDAWSSHKEFPMGIFEVATSQLVGSAGINQIRRMHSTGNAGYWVGAPYRGRGYATAAALMSADFASVSLA